MGNIYVSEEDNRIRKVDSKGVVTTFFNFDKTSSGISSLYMDVTGNLQVSTNNVIYKIPLTGYSINPSLPAGLNFDATTGIISGTPSAYIPTTNFTVSAFNNSGSSSATINFKVNSPPAPIISYNSPQYFTVNAAIKRLQLLRVMVSRVIKMGRELKPVLETRRV